MSDPVEDIADAMVDFLNGSKTGWPQEPTISFSAVKTADPTPFLQVEKLSTTQVFVIPFGESYQRTDRGGGGMETYSVFLLIVREVNKTFTMEKLGLFARQLKLAIRKNRRIGGYVFSRDETTFKYQMEALQQYNHFANSTRFDFIGMA